MATRVRDYYVSEVDHLLAQGVSPVRIPERLGVRPDTLARALYREHRHDIARLFRRVAVDPSRVRERRRMEARRAAR